MIHSALASSHANRSDWMALETHWDMHGGNKMQKTRTMKQCLVCTTLYFLTFGAGASDAGSRSGETIEEVVVTAMKREQNILDAPVAVQNFSGDLVEELQLRDAFDLA
ncbi:MAG: hypothetical protein O2782_13970, partial [bacterium]|nr:hypothetical protein [bacterium]